MTREYSFDQKDVRIETFRSGSMLNVADHAVRVVHIPTGLAFIEDAPIGQHRNRAKAFEKLDAALKALKWIEKRGIESNQGKENE